MNKFNGYEDAKKSAQYSGSAKLPKGGYVAKILGVKLEEGKNGNSDQIVVQFDITEGEYAGFFKKQYDNNTSDDKKFKGVTRIWCPKDDGTEQDGWTKTAFARWTSSLEESNSGYAWDWDEKKWKNKEIGLVFRETGTVIEGKEVVYTEVDHPEPVAKIKDGTFKEGKFKARNGYTGNGNTSSDSSNNATSDFVNVSDGIEEELPF